MFFQVREKLLALKRRRQTIERNKMDAKMKKYGKQVQHAVLRERQQKKREMLNAVKKYQKGENCCTKFTATNVYCSDY